MAFSQIATYDNIRTKINNYDASQYNVGETDLLNSISQDWYGQDLATVNFSANPSVGLGVPFSKFSSYYNKNTNSSIYIISYIDNSVGDYMQIWDSSFTTASSTQLMNISDMDVMYQNSRSNNPITLDISAGTNSPTYMASFALSESYYPLVSATRSLAYSYCTSVGNYTGTINVDGSLLSSKSVLKQVTLSSSLYYFGTQTSSTIYSTNGTFSNSDKEIYNTYIGTKTQTNHWHYPTHVDVSFYGDASTSGTLYWKTDRFHTETITLSYNLNYVTASGTDSSTGTSMLTISSSTGSHNGSLLIYQTGARYWGTKSSSTNSFNVCSISTTDASVILSSSTGSCATDCSYTSGYSVSYSIDTMTTATGIRNTITHSASSPFAVTYNISTRYNYLTESGNLGIDTVTGTVTVSANATSGYTNVETTYMLNAILSVTVTSISPTTYNGSTVTYIQTGNTY